MRYRVYPLPMVQLGFLPTQFLARYCKTFNGYFWVGGSNDVCNSSVYCWCMSPLEVIPLDPVLESNLSGSAHFNQWRRSDKCLSALSSFLHANSVFEVSDVYLDVM